MAASSNVTGYITIDAQVFATAARQLLKTAGRINRKVSIAFGEGKLSIGYDEVTVSVPAQGEWPGTAIVSKSFVRTMSKFDLQQATMILITYHLGHIQIAYNDGMINLGGQGEACKWIPSAA